MEFDSGNLTVNEAVILRVTELLKLRGMTRYRLEQNSDIQHSQMDFILKNRNKTVTFTTVIKLAKGFNMTLLEFLNSAYFDAVNLNIE
jgi:transcriptional regulator with XRE-family HTH domain